MPRAPILDCHSEAETWIQSVVGSTWNICPFFLSSVNCKIVLFHVERSAAEIKQPMHHGLQGQKSTDKF
jgi:hypothetical protein